MNVLRLLFVLFPLFISFAAYPNNALWKAAKAKDWKEVERLIEDDPDIDPDYSKNGKSVIELLKGARKERLVKLLKGAREEPLLESKKEVSKKRKPSEEAGQEQALTSKEAVSKKPKLEDSVSKSRGEKAPVVRQLKSNVPVIEPREIDREEKLSREEKSELMKLAGPIVRQWGYWTGPNGEHEHFELRTHGGMRILQYFTDPVFRNLSRLAYNEQLLSSDLSGYLRTNTQGNSRKYMGDDIWRPFLAEFMSTPGGAALQELAHLNVDSESSEHFAIIVGMARILVDYAYGNRNLPGEGDDLADILGIADL